MVGCARGPSPRGGMQTTIARWKPLVAPTRQEQCLLKRRNRVRKLVGCLRLHRHELFDEACQEELASMDRTTGAGKDAEIECLSDIRRSPPNAAVWTALGRASGSGRRTTICEDGAGRWPASSVSWPDPRSLLARSGDRDRRPPNGCAAQAVHTGSREPARLAVGPVGRPAGRGRGRGGEPLRRRDEATPINTRWRRTSWRDPAEMAWKINVCRRPPAGSACFPRRRTGSPPRPLPLPASAEYPKGIASKPSGVPGRRSDELRRPHGAGLES